MSTSQKRPRVFEHPRRPPAGNLLRLPFELHVQIASTGVLDPLDLVRMSRTCQDLHEVIMGDDYVWRCLAHRVFKFPPAVLATPTEAAAWIGRKTSPPTWRELLIPEDVGERKFGVNVLGEWLHPGAKAQDALAIARVEPGVADQDTSGPGGKFEAYMGPVCTWDEGVVLRGMPSQYLGPEVLMFNPKTHEQVWAFAPGRHDLPEDDLEGKKNTKWNFVGGRHYGKWLVTFWDGGRTQLFSDRVYAAVHEATPRKRGASPTGFTFVRMFYLFTVNIRLFSWRACTVVGRFLICAATLQQGPRILTFDITTGQTVSTADPASLGPLMAVAKYSPGSQIRRVTADDEFCVFSVPQDAVVIQRSTGTAVCTLKHLMEYPTKYHLEGLKQIDIAMPPNTEQVTLGRVTHMDSYDAAGGFRVSELCLDRPTETIVVKGHGLWDLHERVIILVLVNYRHAFTGQAVRGKAWVAMLIGSTDVSLVTEGQLSQPMSGRLLLPLIQRGVVFHVDSGSFRPFSEEHEDYPGHIDSGSSRPFIEEHENYSDDEFMSEDEYEPPDQSKGRLVPCIVDWKTAACAAEIRVIQMPAGPIRIQRHGASVLLPGTAEAKSRAMEGWMDVFLTYTEDDLTNAEHSHLSHSGASIMVYFGLVAGLNDGTLPDTFR